MRFSLKWILISMAYAALSAAALTQDGWAYTDALWAITLIAVAYSVLVGIIASSKQRATAIGFAVFAIVFLACVVVTPESVPSQRLLVAAGVEVGDTIIPVAASGVSASVASGTFVPSSGALTYAAPLSVTIANPPTARLSTTPTGQAFKMISGAERFAPKLRAANSVGAMTFGILGAVLGAYAWRRVTSEPST